MVQAEMTSSVDFLATAWLTQLCHVYGSMSNSRRLHRLLGYDDGLSRHLDYGRRKDVHPLMTQHDAYATH